MSLLDQIKNANFEELNVIAGDIRNRIIDVISQNGGHLAPSLGVVELAIALHRVFNSPTDAIVWDVGHQAYPHKIITGRDALFDTVRKAGGLSGFPKRSESEHDAFGVGHSSTSIAAALGIAEAKKMKGEPGKAIAVIGDGSLTGGLAYEALNNAGHLHNKRLIVVLNDNQMSIDRNVGAIADFMNRGLTHPTYNRIRRDVRLLLNLVSTKELNVLELTRKAAAIVKDFFFAGSLFGAFGFRYIGPVDGHDIEKLVEVLEGLNISIDEDDEGVHPILLHVITKKGKGYNPAEGDPTKFHGISSFNVESGMVEIKTNGNPSYTSIFGRTMCELISVDSRVVAITAAMPSGTGLDKVKERYPGRYYDVGIAEQHAVVFAAGLATKGFRPVVAIYSSFLQRAYDAIIQDVCLQNLPVIFAIDRAGVVGEDGPTHHGIFDLTYLRAVPNLVVMSPKDEGELRNMVASAISYACPVAIRYPRGEGLGVQIDGVINNLPISKAEVILPTEGKDVVIWGIGNMVPVASDAARLLEEGGIKTGVVNARFVKPMDEALLISCAKGCKKIVTIEDNCIAGGFGSAVMEVLNRNSLKTDVIRVGYPDVFVEHASIPELHRKYGLTAEGVVEAVTSEQ